MPQYCYKCRKCGAERSDHRGMSDPAPKFVCLECDMEMIRHYRAEGVSIGVHDYATPLVSQSLAMHPEQIAEHRERFPKIEVQADGCPVFHNTNEHSKYLKEIGWKKQPQRRKRTKLPSKSQQRVSATL